MLHGGHLADRVPLSQRAALSFTSDRGPFDWQKQQGLTEESAIALTEVDPKRHHETGCRFIGKEGWVHVTRGAISAEPASLLQKPVDPTSTGIVVSNDHHVNFLECVRRPPRAGLDRRIGPPRNVPGQRGRHCRARWGGSSNGIQRWTGS